MCFEVGFTCVMCWYERDIAGTFLPRIGGLSALFVNTTFVNKIYILIWCALMWLVRLQFKLSVFDFTDYECIIVSTILHSTDIRALDHCVLCLKFECTPAGRGPTGFWARVRNRGRLENRGHVVPKTEFQDIYSQNYHFGLVCDMIYQFLGIEAKNDKFGMFCKQYHPSLSPGWCR